MKNFEVETDNLIYIKKNYLLVFLGQAFLMLCTIIALFILAFSFFYVSSPVKGVSMQPTLNKYGDEKQDIVYINQYLNYDYGDIIVIEKDTAIIDVKYIIKRVIGVAGDRINIKQDPSDNKIYVYRNDIKLVENYVFNIGTSGDPNNHGMQATLDQFFAYRSKVLANQNAYPDILFDKGELVLQKGQVFVLGDNRGYSIDSSADGPFKTKDVIGRVDFVLPHGVSPFMYFLKYFTGIDLTGF